MTAKKPKRPSAGARIRDNGRSLIWVTLDAAQKDRVRLAAAAEGLPMSRFLERAGLAAADVVLAKILK